MVRGRLRVRVRAGRLFSFSALLAGFAVLVCAAPASALVYWTVTGNTQFGNSIGRANLDGSNANNAFLSSPDVPCGIAVDDEYVYWTHRGTTPGKGGIARARLDGSEVELQFVDTRNAPCGVAVTDTHIYWADWQNGSFDGTKIGRAKIDGSDPDPDFITTGIGVCGLAVDDEYIYWTRRRSGADLGRAKLDGTQVNDGFITAAGAACGVAVNSTHIYWAQTGSSAGAGVGSIGRAKIDGSDPDPEFIPNDQGVQNPCGIAVDDHYLYWGSAGPLSGTSSISRAPLAGTPVHTTFITTELASCGVAVTPAPVPAPVCTDLGHSVQAGESVALALSCTGEGAFTYEVVDQPAHGTLSELDVDAGTVRYTPEPSFQGTDTFTYRATNAGGPSKLATVTIDVTPPATSASSGSSATASAARPSCAWRSQLPAACA